MIRVLLLLAFLVSGPFVSVKGDPFRNLGFEEADVTGLKPGDLASTSQLLPGWEMFQGTFQRTEIAYDYQVMDYGVISLFDTPRLGAPIDGKFYLRWVDKFNSSTEPLTQTSLMQKGDVPGDAKTLQFATLLDGPIGLQINGNDIPLVATGFRSVAADVSAFAGQNVELKFISKPSGSPQIPQWGIDDVEFLTTPIPEPSTWAIWGCGVMLLIGSRFHRGRFISQN